MGSPDGVPIPVYQNGIQAGFRKDQDGNTVVTKLDEQALRQIAEAGDGMYIRATNQQDELDTIFKDIQTMEKKEFGAKIFTEYEDRFQYFLAIALLLLLVEYFISERKNRWLSKWNFFKERK
jgi:Ca-activated chloride channel family protein